MRESQLLEHIFRRSRGVHGRGAVVIGPGDDCAVLDFSGGLTLATVDQVVEGRHYDPSITSIDQIARKAVARSVSDIGAMAGTPLCGLATGCLRKGFVGADELFDRMHAWGEHFGCPLAGGDISSFDGPTVLTVTVLGRADADRGPVLRSTASPGDLVCVTGAVGGAFESGRHLSFVPRVAEARELCQRLGPRLTSMIDVSDGVGRDASRLARASEVRLELEVRRVPLNPEVTDWRAGLGGGEDYELLFTVGPGSAPPERLAGGVRVSVIGRVVEGNGCVVVDEQGRIADASELGWDHG